MFFVVIFKVRIDSMDYSYTLFSHFAVTLQFMAFSFIITLNTNWESILRYKLYFMQII